NGEEQSQCSAFNDSLRCRLIVNLSSDMRSRREPERGTVRQFDEPVPWRPASNPLPRFLNREKCCADDPPIAWHVFYRSDATLCGEAQIDHVRFNLFTLPGLDGFRTELAREIGLSYSPVTKIRSGVYSRARFPRRVHNVREHCSRIPWSESFNPRNHKLRLT